MKTKFAFILSFLTIALAMPMRGQNAQDNKTKTDMKKNDMSDMKKNDMSDMTAKPTFEATTAGLHLKVWIMAKGEGMNDNDMSADKATSEGMMAGTHHIMVEVKDASGKEVADANAKVMVKSPTNKSSSVDLKTMIDQYGGNLTLDEKGEYELTVSLEVKGVANTTPFKYTVQ